MKATFKVVEVVGFGEVNIVGSFEDRKEAIRIGYKNEEETKRATRVKTEYNLVENKKYSFKEINGWHSGIFKSKSLSDWAGNILWIEYLNGGMYQINEDGITEVIID